MIDHTKYDEINVKTLMSDNQYIDDAAESLDGKIKQAINQLISKDYDIIDIKQNVTGLVESRYYVNERHYAMATIYYGKPKAVKK